MASKSFLICFVGMDGTGKTTQAKRLVSSLEADGVGGKYVWNTYQPCLTRPFLFLGKVFFFRGKDAFQDYNRYTGIKMRLFNNPFLAWVYEQLSLFDYWCQSVVTVWLPLKFGRNLVCDRYGHDVAANLAAELVYSPKKLKRRLNRVLGWLPKPDLVFLIDVPEEIGYERKDDTPSVEHLKSRRQVYLDIGEECGAIMLDGVEDPAQLASAILSKVKYTIGQGEHCLTRAS